MENSERKVRILPITSKNISGNLVAALNIEAGVYLSIFAEVYGTNLLFIS